MAGANFIFQSAGWLEGGLTIGYEKFVMDLDRCGAIHRMTQGLTIDANELAADAYQEAGIGSNFLGVAHTLRNFRTANYRAELADTNSFEQWTEDGGKDQQHRACERWQQMLGAYEAPPIDSAIDEALLDFIARKKASMVDAWY
jgi:trimethylamine--corrinoid protein Co-methyltransferase